MKALSIIFVSLLSISAFAAPKATAIRAQNIEIERIPCPAGKVCAAVVRSKLIVTYGALGCLDKITAKIGNGGITDDGKQRIYLSGLNYHNPKSKKVMCIRQPTATFEYKLAPGKDTLEDLEIIELGLSN